MRRYRLGWVLLGVLVVLPWTAAGDQVDTNLFVTSWDGGVYGYTLSGQLVRLFAESPRKSMCSRFGLDGDLYVTVYEDGTIVRYDGGTGGALGVLAWGLSYPTDLAFDSQGNLYVAEETANRVSVFTPAGSLVGRFYSGVSTPEGLAFRPNGHLLVTNTYGGPYKHTITDIDPTTGAWYRFTSGLSEPMGITAGPDGRFYVCNYTYSETYGGGPNPDTVQVISAGGANQGLFVGKGTLNGASYLAFSDGVLAVTSFYGHRVNLFSAATGSSLGSIAVPFSPIGVTIREHQQQSIRLTAIKDLLTEDGYRTFLSNTQITIQAQVDPPDAGRVVKWTVEGLEAAAGISGFPAESRTTTVEGGIATFSFTPDSNGNLITDRKENWAIPYPTSEPPFTKNAPLAFEVTATLRDKDNESRVVATAKLSQAGLGSLEQHEKDVLRQEYLDYWYAHPSEMWFLPTYAVVVNALPPESNPDRTWHSAPYDYQIDGDLKQHYEDVLAAYHKITNISDMIKSPASGARCAAVYDIPASAQVKVASGYRSPRRSASLPGSHAWSPHIRGYSLDLVPLPFTTDVRIWDPILRENIVLKDYLVKVGPLSKGQGDGKMVWNALDQACKSAGAVDRIGPTYNPRGVGGHNNHIHAQWDGVADYEDVDDY